MKWLCAGVLFVAVLGCANEPPPPRASIPPVGTFTQTPDSVPRPLPGPDPYIEGRLPMDPPPAMQVPPPEVLPPLQTPSPLLPPPPATLPNP